MQDWRILTQPPHLGGNIDEGDEEGEGAIAFGQGSDTSESEEEGPAGEAKDWQVRVFPFLFFALFFLGRDLMSIAFLRRSSKSCKGCSLINQPSINEMKSNLCRSVLFVPEGLWNGIVSDD